MSDLILWLDLETTGLDPQRDRILELGLVITAGLERIVDEREELQAAAEARALRAEEAERAALAEVERLRAGLGWVVAEHGRQKWHPDTKWPTEAAKHWHDGYITASAHFAIVGRKYLDPAQAAEGDETWRIGTEGTDVEWYERTGHCGHCGIVASSCNCDGECGCWELHGPPLDPWQSLPQKLAAAEAEGAQLIDDLRNAARAMDDKRAELNAARAAIDRVRALGPLFPVPQQYESMTETRAYRDGAQAQRQATIRALATPDDPADGRHGE